ncbi:hypothetical protein [Streptomyces sp. NPDC048637]|uniref:hypothetical protein n=1 Tax=Streptomyces sp. NPDC048637 TaxID=3155636 RepID=UPI00341CAEFB
MASPPPAPHSEPELSALLYLLTAPRTRISTVVVGHSRDSASRSSAAAFGWAQMSRRLRHSTDWDPARTFGFAALGDSRVPALAGPATLQGMRGATVDGGTWAIDRGWVTQQLPARTPPLHPRGTL